MTDNQPNPFSREGSNPADGLGAEPPAGGYPTGQPSSPDQGAWQHQGWQAYPDQSGGTPGWELYNNTNPAPRADPAAAPGPSVPYGAGAPDGSGQDPTVYYGGGGYPGGGYEGGGYPASTYLPTYGSYGSDGSYAVGPTQHPQALVALITGLAGVIVCAPVGIVGLVTGNKARREIDAEPGRYSGRGMAMAGLILGIVSALFTVFWVVFIALGANGYFD